MAKKIKVDEVSEQPTGQPEIVTETPIESAEKTTFRKLIEDYGKANPVKYDGKKEALQAQLDAMK